MKLTGILLLAACLQLSARGLSQTITYSAKNVSIPQIFSEVIKQTGITIVYKEDLISALKPIDITVKDATIEEVLSFCLKNQPFRFVIDGSLISVEPIPAGGVSLGLQKKGLSPQPVFETPPITVRGRIVNENGEPVIASVIIKGTTRGTTSNSNGEFELNNVDNEAVLIISATNIETISINAKSQLNISVKFVASSLNEVVINKGYYSETKRVSTGNVAKVDAKTIEKQPVSNPLQTIQGRMAGVYVQQTSGIPGGGIDISIRGRNSLRDDGNQPLYIVDGVPFASSINLTGISGPIVGAGNPLNTISISSIESIQILKDADATSIYGSRGFNGVVLITTRKGKAGEVKTNINFSQGFAQVAKKMDLLNTKQYLEMRREAFENDNRNLGTGSAYDILLWDTTRYTDWQKELLGGSADYTNAQLNFSGGSANTQFLIGLNYYRETTVFPGDFAFVKGSGHFNLNHNSTDNRLQISLSNDYTITDNNLPDNDQTSRAISLPPNTPEIYDEEGNLNWGPNFTFANPYGYLKRPYQAVNKLFSSNLRISYELFPKLFLKGSFGYNALLLDERAQIPISSQPKLSDVTGSATTGKSSATTWIAEPQLEYSLNIGKGTLQSLAGLTIQQSFKEQQMFGAYGYTSDALLENILAANRYDRLVDDYSQYKYNAGFARINYNWDKKYIINLTGRRDGSSRFGAGRQFANFASVGTAWIFSNEKFASKWSFLSFGKLRTSYGTAGNDQIGDYQYLDSYSTLSYLYNNIIGLIPSRLPNRDYSWEINKKFEAGLELGFLNDKINLAASWYKNKSSNQLVGLPLPFITGQTSIQYNFPATVENTGLELEVNSTNMRKRQFSWTTSFNITIPKNKLVSFQDIEKFPSYSNLVIGEPITSRKVLQYKGVDPATGLHIFEDFDNNGNGMDAPADYQVIRNASQHFFGGITNNLTFSNWELDFTLQFVKQTGHNYTNSYSRAPGNMFNQPVLVMNRWQKMGDESAVQKFTSRSSAPYSAYAGNSTASFVNASFVRLKNLSLSWNCPASLLSKLHMKAFKVYVQGQNLLTITDYFGFDPENQDFSRLPPLRVFAAGIQVTL